MKASLTSFFVGLVFALGLGVSGMTEAAKVVAFLDFFGDWDPSLMFVMGGAILVYLPAYRLIRKRDKSAFGFPLLLPNRTDLSPRLIVGAILFGVGWGLGGFCPGPGLVAGAAGSKMAFVFIGAMAAGMALFRVVDRE